MPQESYEREYRIAIGAARGAGAIQMQRYERLEQIVHKSEKDVVTEVDELSEQLIIGAIRAAFPSDAVLAEESGRTTGEAARDAGGERRDVTPAPGADGRLWIVDPLDGTVNYANGIPVFCVSIALAVGGRPVVGVIYDPSRDDLYAARAGGGATLNERAIVHQGKPRLVDAVVALALPPARFALRERRIKKAVRVTRDLGSASLAIAYVANGRFDACIQSGGLSLWDIAAAGLIAEEAGACVTAPDGSSWFDLARSAHRMGLVAASPEHHATLLAMLH